ncbi:DeoR/GlpR family DNA-binding transcription regulator [Azospirillum sp. ST 5-10]|uniref:DeoR/GlpR family DNA-binding transcription regulator n=1 Tax=unclassified Azospirillum TaxID=2630922 RepID=UPI003F4A30D2
MMPVLAADRQAQILDRLKRDGRVRAAELADAFATSEDTIRRDLRDLAARGLCRRVYGGALATSPAGIPARDRAGQAPGRKSALGAALAGLVRRNQLLFIDAGTTNLAAAAHLPEGLGLTVATHDPAIAAALSGRGDVDLLLVGGRVDPHVGAALGAGAAREIAAMSPDLLLLGACALDAGAGLAAFHSEDAAIKRLLVERAGAVAVAVLNEKLGTAAPFTVCAADRLADVVVEADAPAAAAAALAAAGPRLHRASPANDRS